VFNGRIAQVNYVANASLNKLAQSTKYILYAVMSTNLGTSDIATFNFTTGQISNGVQMILKFNSIVTNLVLVKALESVLRVSPLRIKVLTSSF